MATQVTVREEKFHNLWQRVAGGCQVYPIEAPGLVELVESGEENSPAALQLLQRLLEPYVGELDALVLGCTHYPLLLKKIRQFTPEHIQLVPQGEYVAHSLQDYLKRHPEMDARCSKNGISRFLTTESTAKFEESASIFLQEESINVESITLE